MATDTLIPAEITDPIAQEVYVRLVGGDTEKLRMARFWREDAAESIRFNAWSERREKEELAPWQ